MVRRVGAVLVKNTEELQTMTNQWLVYEKSGDLTDEDISVTRSYVNEDGGEELDKDQIRWALSSICGLDN